FHLTEYPSNPNHQRVFRPDPETDGEIRSPKSATEGTNLLGYRQNFEQQRDEPDLFGTHPDGEAGRMLGNQDHNTLNPLVSQVLRKAAVGNGSRLFADEGGRESAPGGAQLRDMPGVSHTLVDPDADHSGPMTVALAQGRYLGDVRGNNGHNIDLVGRLVATHL